MREFSLSVPREACYLQAVRGFFKPILEKLFPGEGEMLILALDEAASNFVKHQCELGHEEALQISATLHPDRLRFHLGNFCARGDVPRIRPRDLEEVRPGGLGTHLIDRIMDRVEFRPETGREGRMSLILDKFLPGHGGTKRKPLGDVIRQGGRS